VLGLWVNITKQKPEFRTIFAINNSVQLAKLFFWFHILIG